MGNGRRRPDGGDIRLFGLPAAERERQQIGWVPQELAIYPKLSARENLSAFGSYSGLRGAALRAAIERGLLLFSGNFLVGYYSAKIRSLHSHCVLPLAAYRS